MTWTEILSPIKKTEYFKNLSQKIEEEYREGKCFPPKKQIFRALELTRFEDIKVVIIGQDPYHGVGEAHGFAFSTLSSKLPPSLKNIYKELYDDLGIEKDYNNYTYIERINYTS